MNQLTIARVAKIMNTSEQTVRIGLQLGIFDFGAAIKLPNSSRYTYILYPEKFYSLYGKGQG